VPQATTRDTVFIRNLVVNLSEAIHCLHENDIIHCDIKPPNVLVRSLTPPDLVLTDFGISSVLAADASNKMTSLKGTPMYWAPEAFSRMIGRPGDWWGLGMIVLELLTGRHPFEGMTDSQIIRELTIGNVEVPGSIAPEWSLLVKGLLTKNDAKRWGYDEVARWLSGARDIPVHYEESRTQPSSGSAARSGIPFRLEGNEYFTAEELAHAFAASETPWASAQNHMREVRQWLEDNMLFEEAANLGNDISDLDPERGLFRFVHTNAKCPFSFLGKLIDIDNLRLFLWRVSKNEASGAEKRVAEMLDNGRLALYYDEYVKISDASRDLFLYNLLLFMAEKKLYEQLEYFGAIMNPEMRLWPEDVQITNGLETIEALRKIGAVPLIRDDFEALKSACVLPAELLSVLGKASTYAEGLKALDRWKTEGLLLPKDATYEKLGLKSLNEYEKAAWRNHVHSQAVIELIDYLANAQIGRASCRERVSVRV
jgi:hypothetical protein